MVQCEYSVLLEIYNNINKIMSYLHISQGDKPDLCEEEILSAIMNGLYRTIDYLVGGGEQGKEGREAQGDMYQNIEKQLQRQQNLNRVLIKKQLQFKEYQKCLLDQLNQERKTVKDLQSQFNKINDRVFSKDLEVLHLNNEKKTINKDKKAKEVFMMQTLINQRKTGDPFKSIKQTVQGHNRRRSDQITRRPTTANPKKKPSMAKK